MKIKQSISMMLAFLLLFTSLPINAAATEIMINNYATEEFDTVSGDVVTSVATFTDITPVTTSAPTENIINTTVFGGDTNKGTYCENLTYINGALCFYADNTYYVLPKAVTDTQYIWPDGSVDNIDTYVDEYYNNIVPVKDFNKLYQIGYYNDTKFTPSSCVFTMNDGSEFVYGYDHYIYKSYKDSDGYKCVQIKDLNSITDESGTRYYNDNLSRLGGFSNGFYFTGYQSNDSTNKILYYNYDDVEHIETIAYLPSYTCGIVGDSFYYIYYNSGYKLVRHVLGTSKESDVILGAVNSPSNPQVLLVKGDTDTAYFNTYGLHESGRIYTIDLNTNTLELAPNSANSGVCRFNSDDSVLTISTGMSKSNIDIGNYSATTHEFYIVTADGFSESKSNEDFYGYCSYFLFEDAEATKGYATGSKYRNVDCIALIGNPEATSYTNGKSITLTTGYERNFLYHNSKWGSISFFSKDSTSIPKTISNFTVKSVDGDCTKGLYLETIAGKESLPTVDSPHLKDTSYHIVSYATCAKPQLNGYDCQRCDVDNIETVEVGYPDPYQHTDFFDERNIVRQPTCTVPGLYGYKCFNCDKNVYEYEYLYLVDDDYSDHEQHTYYRYKGYWGDTYVDYDHTYEDYKYIPALGHDYQFKETTVEPTCYVSGEAIYECTRCHGQIVKTVAPTGHSFDTVEVIEEPTCTEEGYSSVKCSDCGLNLKRYRTHKVSHEFELENKNTGLTREVDTLDNYWDGFETTTVGYDEYTYKCKHCGTTKSVQHDTYSYADQAFKGPVNIYDTYSDGEVHIDLENSNGKFYRSTQSISTLDDSIYDKITINDVSIKEFLGTTTEATNITPTTLYEYNTGYSVKYAFKNSCANRSPGYTGAFDFYAYPDDLNITTERFDEEVTFTCDDFYRDSEGNTNVPMKDILYCVVNLKDTHNSNMILDLLGYHYDSYDSSKKHSLGTPTVYSLESGDGVHYTAKETDTLRVWANQNNYYLITIKPDYDAIKQALEDYDCYYNYDIMDPDYRAKAMESFMFGARLVPNFNVIDELEGLDVDDSSNFTRDGLETKHYISEDLTYEDVDSEVSVDFKVDCTNGWHSYSALYNTYGDLYNLSGQYIIHSYSDELTATGAAKYYKGDYENNSNVISVPVTDWAISAPTFKWYFENEDGTRTPISNGTVIDNFKFTITDDVKISGETISNIDSTEEVIVSCDICTPAGDVVKTHYGALVFDNLEPVLTTNFGNDVTVSGNNISVSCNSVIMLDATVRYLKEGTTDEYVDTDEHIDWYFQSEATSKMYKINSDGSLTEDESFEPMIALYSLARSMPSANAIAFTPTENGTLIAKFSGRYGTAQQETGVSLYSLPTGLSAEYNGGPVKVDNDYSKSDVVVKLNYNDGTYDTIDTSDWTVNSTLVKNVGNDNTFTVSYGGYTANFSVTGVDYITGIKAVCSIDRWPVYDTYEKDAVSVYPVYYKGGQSTDSIDSSDWSITEELVIATEGNNTFTVTYDTFSDTYVIDGYLKPRSLEASYGGNDIRVPGNYSKDNVTVTVYYDEARTKSKPLAPAEWSVSTTTVSSTGNNSYTASYTENGYTVNGNFNVTGFKQVDHIKAVYTGATDLEIGESYTKGDVEVIAYYDAEENDPLPTLGNDDWFIEDNSTSLSVAGDNSDRAVYTCADGTFYGAYTVPAVAKLEVTYNGSSIKAGDSYNKDDVTVKLIDGVTDSPVTDWYAHNTWLTDCHDSTYNSDDSFEQPNVTIANHTALYKWNGIWISANYAVPTLPITGIKADYTDTNPVRIGENYIKSNVRVVLVYQDGSESPRLADSAWTESSLSVNSIGTNTYTATYNSFTDTYGVVGYKQEVGIEASYPADKTVKVGDNYSKSDVTVKIVYHDNSKSEPLSDDDWTESGLTVTAVGDNTFTATYKTFTDTFVVPGYREAVGLSAEYTGQPVKVGDNYVKDDVTVKIVYNDGSKSTALDSDDWTESGLTVTAVGDNEFTATYKGFTDDFIVPGFKEEVGLSAKYTGQPVKVGDNYSKSDVEVRVVYHDNSKSVPIPDDAWEPDSLTVTKVGTNDFTATYNGFTADYSVTGFKYETGISAEYTGQPVKVGDNYVKDDVTVKIVYNDGSKSEPIPESDWTESGLTITKVGDNDFTATYKTFTTDFTVPGFKQEVGISAEYKGQPIKMGTNYSKSDVTVKIVYNDGSKSEALDSDDWKANSLLVTKVGINDFTATYNGFTADYSVTGFKYETGISASYTGVPVEVGFDYSKSDVEVCIVYSDGSTSEPLSDDSWEPDSLIVTKVGDNEFTATYKGFSDEFVVPGYTEAVTPVPVKIVAEYKGKPVKTGEEYKKSDVEVCIVYSDGSTSEPLSDTDWKESSLTVTKVGDNTFTATYEELTSNFVVPGILVVSGLKAKYTGDPVLVGNRYKKSDVEVRIVYHDDSTSEPLSDADWKASGTIVKKEGSNTFEATYDGLQAGYTVTGYTDTPVPVSVNAIYKGDDIPIGNKYKKSDVEVCIVYSDGSTSEPLNDSDWEESSLLVTKVGDNEFTATYKGFSDEFKVKGYTLPGDAPVPVSVNAIYKGDDIPIGSEYKRSDVEVTVTYDNGDTRVLRDSEWTANSTLVTKVGDNEFTAAYKGFSDDFTVPGILVIKSLKATYKGKDVSVGESYLKKDVEVRIVYHDDSTSEPLSDTDWKESSLIVSKSGANKFTATYNDLQAGYTVTGYAVPVKIVAEYKGKPVKTGEDYNKDDVVITVVYSDSSTKVISSKEWTANSTLVTKVGDNTFTATYEELTSNFVVPGYTDTPVPVKIVAEYKGDPVLVGNKYKKSDVEVTVTYDNGDTRVLRDTDWKESSLLVTKEGSNTFEATYDGLTAEFVVTGYLEVSGLKAKYTGDPVLVGNKYKKSDVEVKVVYHDGTTKKLSKSDWEASGTIVEKEGSNTFEATYEGFSDEYKVKGYTLPEDAPVTPTITPTPKPTVSQNSTVVHTGVNSNLPIAVLLFLLGIFGICIYFFRSRKSE